MDIRFTVDADLAIAAFERSPEVMYRHLSEGTEEGAHFVGRAAKRNARTVTSALANSIRVEKLEGLPEGVVGHQAVAGVRYAPYVEEGTGPAAGRPRYYPNIQSLVDFLSSTVSTRGFKWERTGSFVRLTQQLEVYNRARRMAWSIYTKGTKAHPFMRPAMEASDSAVRAGLRRAQQRGIVEVFGA